MERIRYFMRRYNFDPFRLCIDFFVLILLYYLCQDYLSHNWSLGLLYSFYLLLLIYQIYFSVIEKIFKSEPVFYSDRSMMKTGWDIFFKEFSFLKLLALLGLGIFLVGIFFLLQNLLLQSQKIQFSQLTWVIIMLVLVLSAYSIYRSKNRIYSALMFQSPIRSLSKNMYLSYTTYLNIKDLTIEKLASYNHYSTIKLKQKPNIIFLVIESYGRIMYDNEQLYKDYKSYMTRLEKQLQEADFYSTSHLSLSPIVAGGSWVSYCNLMFGFNFVNQGTYMAMLNNEEIHQYESLFQWLQNKGYQNYRLNGMAGYENMEIPWEKYSRLYAVNEWIRYKDLAYKGPLYGFGPSPPDQYSINYAYNYIKNKKESPFSLFYITQNSHTPFLSPEGVVDDWKDLVDETHTANINSVFFQQPKLKDYQQSIRYQMETVVDFVVKNCDEDDIIIVVGDHQPPELPKEKTGLHTPIHLIAKDKSFIKNFESYGFNEGLLVADTAQNIKHEGLYSMLMRELIAVYSDEDKEQFKYYPDGLKLS